MIKRFSKKILIAIFVFFASLTSLSAKEMNINELAEEVKNIQPNTTYIYMIGEYVFTSEHILTTQDVMLASRSIVVNDVNGKTDGDPIYGEMTIAYFEGIFDENYQITGLKYVKNVVGNTAEKDTYNVNYIDYNRMLTEVDVDALVDDAYNTIKKQAPKNKFITSKTDNTIEVMLVDLNMASTEALRGTGIATAAANFLNQEGIKSVTLDCNGVSVEITKENLDAEKVETFLKEVLGESGKASELVGKEIKATINLEDGYKTSGSSEFSIKFTEQKKVDVDALVETAYNTIKNQAATDKFIVKKTDDKNVLEVMLVDLTMDSVDALRGTGIATAAANFLNQEGIESVTLDYNGTKIKITKDNLNADEIETFAKAVLGESGKASELVGKQIKATIGFKEGYKTANSNEFSIKFTEQEEVDVDTLVDAAYNTIKGQAATDKFIVKKEENANIVEVMLVDLTMDSVDALSGTGVATAAANFLNQEGIKSVTLTCNGTSVEITKDNLDAEKVEAFLKAVLGESGKASELVGKEITATIGFEEEYKTANSSEFSIKFTEQNKIDVDKLVDDAYNTIQGQAATDKFIVKKTDDKNVLEVMLVDLNMSSVDALSGTGIATAAANFLKTEGIKSVTLTYNDKILEINKESLDPQKVDEFFKAILGESGKAAELVGKQINATIGFEEEYKTANSNEFSIKFTEQNKVDVDALVNDAYNTIQGQAATDKFIVKKTDDKNVLEVMLVDLTMDSVDALSGTGIATAAANFLNQEGIKSVTLTCNGTSVEITKDNLDAEKVEAFLKAVLGESGKASELVGKEITATIGFEEEYKTSNSSEFSIKFTEQNKVDIDKLVDDAYNTIKGQAATDKFIVKKTDDKNVLEVMLVDLTMDSIDALSGTGVATAAANFLKTEGIKSVTLTCNGTSVEITKDNLDAEKVEAFLKAVLGESGKASELVGKEITATIGFEEEYKTSNSSEFSIKFTEQNKVDIDKLVDDAYKTIKGQAATDKFIVKKTDDKNVLEVMLVDLTMDSVDALSGTGVATAAMNFLNQEGIESVTLDYNGTKIKITKDNLNADEIETFAKAVLGESGTVSELVGKEITATIGFKEEYKTSNSSEFSIKFTEQAVVVVDALVTDAYNTIKDQAATDKFIAKKTGNVIEVILTDLTMDSVEALRGTGIATAAANFLNREEVESVTLVYNDKSLEINKENLDAEKVEAFLKAVLGESGKASELVGKEIKATVNLNDEYKASDSNKFSIKFTKQIEVDVDSLVDDAYNTIKGQAATNKFIVKKTDDKNVLEVMLVDLTMDSVEALRGTGVATAAANFLKTEGIESVTLDYNGTKTKITKDNLNADEIETFAKAVLGESGKASELVGKQIKATIGFEDEYKTANSSEFSIKFTEQAVVVVDAIVTDAYNVINNQAPKNKFIAKKTDNVIKVILTDLTMNSVEALRGTGVATAAMSFLNREEIKSITLSYNDKSLEINKENLDAEKVEEFAKALVGENGTASELVGKEIKATVNLNDEYKVSGSSEFSINFTKQTELDVDALVTDAYNTIKGQAATDKFIVKKAEESNIIEVMLVDLTMDSVDALSGTGIATAASNFLNQEGIESVTLTYNDKSLEINKENLDAEKVEEFAKALVGETGTASELVGKEIKATVNLNDEYKASGSSEFSIKFTEQTEVVVNALVTAAYNTIKNQATTDKFIVKKEEESNLIEVMLVDLTMNSVEALRGTGVATAASNFLNQEGIESVTLVYNDKSLEINKENLDAVKVEEFARALVGENGNASELVGKEIKATVNLNDEYKASGSSEFSIKFTEQTEVVVNALVNDAYNTIKDQAATDKFIVKKEEESNSIKVILTDLTMDSVEALRGTGVATAAMNFLNQEGIESVTLTYNDKSVEINKENLDAEKVEEFARALVSENGNSSELVGKEIKATANLKDEYKASGSSEFSISFTKQTELDVDTLVNDAFVTIKNQAPKNKFIVKKLENTNVIEVMLVDTTMDSIEALRGTGVATAAANFLNQEGIKSVTLDYNGTKLEISKENMDADGIETFVKAVLGESGKASELVGKQINATIGFEDEYKTANSNEFSINFTEQKKVDVDSLVDDAYETIKNQAPEDKFIVKKEENKNVIDVMLVDLTMDSVDALSGTGIATAASNFLNQEGIKSVTLTYNDKSLEINKDNLNADEIETFAKAVLGENGTVSELIGKQIKATIGFEEEYKTANSNEFNISFQKMTYKVEFYDENGTTKLGKVSVGYNENATYPNGTPSKAATAEYTYTFDGWDVSLENIKANTKAKAKYVATKNKYTVTFNSDGGTEAASQEIEYGSKAVKPETTKEGHDFIGWTLNGSEYDFNTPITGNITLVANWKIKTYKVEFYDEDGTSKLGEVVVNYNENATYPNGTPSKAATAEYTYTFDGWDVSLENIKVNTKAIAKYVATKNKYTVTYVDSSNQVLGTQIVEYGTKASELTFPSKDGKVVTKYTKDSSDIDENYEIIENTTLKVEYAEMFNIDEVLSSSLDGINSEYYSAELDKDSNVIKANFKDPNLEIVSIMGDVLELLKSLTGDEHYQSVKLSYNDNPEQAVELKGSINALKVARFVGLVAAGSWSGSLGYQATVDQLVTATSNKPITVTATLVDGCADPTGKSVVVYYLVFTCEQ